MTASEQRTLNRISLGMIKGAAVSIEDAANVQSLREQGKIRWTGTRWVIA